ncbi:MAG: DUF6807 family protein, partial [Bryobacteraceae bacterium]
MRAMLVGVLAAAVAWSADITFRQETGRVEIRIGAQPFSNFYYGPDRMKPFLHPLRSVSGAVVTRSFPVEKIAGESIDHVWHHGLWYAHGDINGVDFWRDLGMDKTGRIVVQGQPAISRDTLTAECALQTPTKQILGTMRQRFRFARDGQTNIVDAEVTIRADRGAALKLGDTEEGALGFRFADEFKEDRGAVLTNSDGLIGTKNIWGKRAKWVDYSTTLNR